MAASRCARERKRYSATPDPHVEDGRRRGRGGREAGCRDGPAFDHGEEGEVGALPRWPAVFVVVV